MSAFTLDTSGAVPNSTHSPNRELDTHWYELSLFEQGYIEALLRSMGEAVERYNSVDERSEFDCARFSDLAPETLAAIRKDCADDQRKGIALNLAGNTEDRTSADAGRKFWLERQTGNLFDCPPLTPYLSDDGKVCLREAK